MQKNVVLTVDQALFPELMELKCVVPEYQVCFLLWLGGLPTSMNSSSPPLLILTILVHSAAARGLGTTFKKKSLRRPLLPLSFVACYGRPQLRFINYLYGVFHIFRFLMRDSSSDNVSCISVVMFYHLFDRAWSLF